MNFIFSTSSQRLQIHHPGFDENIARHCWLLRLIQCDSAKDAR